MRKMMLAAMLVTVAAPAMAQDHDGLTARRAERQQQREQRGEAPAGEARQQQPQEVRQPRVEQRQEQRVEPQRAERAQEWRRAEQQARPGQQERREQPRVRWSQPAPQAQAPVVQVDGVTVIRRGEQGGARRRWEGQRDAPQSGAWQQQRQQRGEWQQRQQRGGWQQQPQPQERSPQYSGQWQQSPRRDEQQRDGQRWTGQNNGQRWTGHNDGQRWSSHWRNDHRYDWQRYRARNQSIFRIGSYYDPFGWSYRRPSIGITLYAGYYQPDYWLDDPWQYRLPPVYGPYRWVRYYDDALLVDIYSGQVVDVIDNFFW